ncbi:MAG: hypothetical protein ACYTGH_05430 [Planctomycetota bacterium]|jgi:hypothetical protein
MRWRTGLPLILVLALAATGSLPAGLTLEGVATGIPDGKEVRYEQEGNRLIFPGGESYALPIPATEAADLLRALRGDDRLGVSLALSGKLITYGKLRADSSVAKALLKADRLICAVAFARRDWIEGVTLPRNYTPVPVKGRRKIMAVIHTNLDAFGFKLGPKKRLISTGFRINYLIIPISKTRARDGGFLPDRDRMARNEIEETDRKNLAHLNAHQAEYFAMPILMKAGHYGEVAALLRALLKGGVNGRALEKRLRR